MASKKKSVSDPNVLHRKLIELWNRGQSTYCEVRGSEIHGRGVYATTFIPKEIHLPMEVEGDEVLAEWLSTRKAERVYLRYPARGPRASRLALAGSNAELAFRRRFRGARLRTSN